VIAKGRYEGHAPTEASVNGVLQWVFSDSLYELEFADPEDDDVALEAEAVVLLKSRYRCWGHDEAIRDRIVTALVNRLKPEYESQVEVEVVSGPGESGDPCDDEDDGPEPLHRIVRVWQ
jgi:hypothetical protein